MTATQANIVWRLVMEERMKMEERSLKESRERAKRVAGLEDITLAEYEQALDVLAREMADQRREQATS